MLSKAGGVMKRANCIHRAVFRLLPIVLAVLAAPLFSQDTETLYLSGTDSEHTIDWEFYCSGGRQSGYWTYIPVPSNWELHGFGTYNYGHDQPKADETGQYKHSFKLPANWKEKRIYLIFEASMTDTEAWVNKKSVGPMHQGGFYEFQYDVTDLVRFDSVNEFEVTVHKMSSDPSVNSAERDADYWVFGGIFRPVLLKAFPKQHIVRTAIDAEADGKLEIHTYLEGIGSEITIQGQVHTLDGKPVGEAFSVGVPEGKSQALLSTLITGYETWTAETPHLYQVLLSLRKGGQILHTTSERFGFRTFEVRHRDGLYLNGQKIKLKGVNRHSFWPESGRATSAKQSLVDVNLIKDMNMNAVRMSHYPPDRHFLDACDSLGLYVLDELGGWQKPPYDTAVGKKLVREVVIRDVNHPSVLFWDNGNEGGWNTELDEEFAIYDPQKRPVLHPWELMSGIDTKHYTDFDTAQEIVERDIFMPTEFLHGLYDGGSGAGLSVFWEELIQPEPLGAGAFLWVLVDEGVVRTDQGGRIDVDGNHAPDGILGPFGEKGGSYSAVKEIWSPVFLKQMDHLAKGLKITMENRFDFINLKDCLFEWKLIEFPLPDSAQTNDILHASGTARGPDIAPHQTGSISLELGENWSQSDALFLTAYDPRGRELWTWTRPLNGSRLIPGRIVTSDGGPIGAMEDSQHLSITAAGTRFVFSKADASLVTLVREGREYSLANGPRSLQGSSQVNKFEHRPDERGHLITASLSGGLKQLEWIVLPSGWLRLSYSYSPTGEHDFLGISFDYPEALVRGVKWLGSGPYRVWKNRQAGTRLGVWENPYKNNVPGRTWDFPEFKGYFANLHWLRLDTQEGPVTVVSATPNLYFRLFTPEIAGEGLDRHTEVPFPEGDISFLHAIPPIGTKFHKPSELGASGQPNQANGEYTATLYFKFGE